MRIGIDISQLAYKNTGVSNYLENLVLELLKIDKENEYVLFYSSLRKNFQFSILNSQSNLNVSIRKFRIPPTLLDLLWNKLHVIPIEWLIGDVDIFISSDWTEPPTKKAKKATILYDLIVYKYPEETHNLTEFNPLKFIISPNIVASQKKKLKWVKKESDVVFCISESTKKDAMEILGIPEEKLRVIYPGV
jgi:glycosyltransferase involved in cell wall biosynthesis